jgi:hypothetical protein
MFGVQGQFVSFKECYKIFSAANTLAYFSAASMAAENGLCNKRLNDKNETSLLLRNYTITSKREIYITGI